MWPGGEAGCGRTGTDRIARGTRVGTLVALILVTPTSGLAAGLGAGLHPAAARANAPDPSPSFRQLPGLRHVFATVRPDMEALLGEDLPAERLPGSPGECETALTPVPPERQSRAAAACRLAVARWTEFQRLATAVLGRPDEPRPLAYPDVHAAFAADGPFPAPAEAGFAARDRLALRLATLGYAPHLIADVVSGRLAVPLLEQASRLRLLGHTEAEVARYLEGHMRARTATPPPAPADGAGSTGASPVAALPGLSARTRFDGTVVRLARRHGVDPDLVRAVIRHESAWNPAARSRKGAIGLMQLMPSTSRLLGVDPFDPEQNIAGGVRYLADLLAVFGGNLDAAILGYIGGPGYARSWLRGQTIPDHEVRTYLANVKSSYRAGTARRTD